jgi:hypothetical protein
MSNHVRIRDTKRGGSRCQKVPRNRKSRDKTFSSVKAADTWAKLNKIENYAIVNLKNDSSSKKKIKIVPDITQ